MSSSAEFAEFLKEQLRGFGPVTIRRMFGGAGVYLDKLMFGLIADEVLYLKADDTSRPEFEAEGLGPFVYDAKGGKNIVMSYYRAPERCLDDAEEMTLWARKAYAAALRQRKK
jgi:DNA transformation protein and related proteins